MAFNATEFLYSPDIAAECIRVGKTFTPEEQMTIVAQSRKPMKERMEAYAEIAEAYPEFHETLESIVQYMKNELKSFPLAENGQVFISNNTRYNIQVSTEYPSLLKQCLVKSKNQDIHILKTEINKNIPPREAVINQNGEIMNINYHIGYNEPLNIETLTIKAVDLYLPIPFKKGDLVCKFQDPSKIYIFLESINHMQYRYIEQEETHFTLFTKTSGKLHVRNGFNPEYLTYCKDEPRNTPLKYAQQAIKGEIDIVDALQYMESYMQSQIISWDGEEDEEDD